MSNGNKGNIANTKMPISKKEEGSLQAPNEVLKEEVSAKGTIGNIIAGANLVTTVLGKILDGINVDRKVAFGINNFLDRKLVDSEFYTLSGKIEEVSIEIEGGYAGFGAASKTAGPVATGSVGVLAYSIQDTPDKLAIMWSVPFDYNLYENWFKLSIVGKSDEVNKGLYQDMYYDKGKTKGEAARAKNGISKWAHPEWKSGVKLEGVMGDGGKCTLNISIKPS